MPIGYIVFRAIVCQVQVIGTCGILRSKCIYLLDTRNNAQTFAQTAHFQHRLVSVGHVVLIHRTGYLKVAETLLLGQAQQILGQILGLIVSAQLISRVHDGSQLVQKPAVYLGKRVYAFDIIAPGHSLCYHEYATIGRLGQGMVYIINFYVFVLDKSVHTLPYHSQAFLYGFLESAAYGHNLADTLHRRPNLAIDAMEFAQVPAWDLDNHVVQCRFKECRSVMRHRVTKLKKTITEA